MDHQLDRTPTQRCDIDPDGTPDYLHLIVETKGHRRENAKEKKSTMENYCVPGVNNRKTYGR